MNIKKALKIAMVNESINQHELARLSGISETTISQTINGVSKPNNSTMSKLSKALNISYSDLLKLGE